MDLKDFLGKTFRIGDEIVYPGRKGSSLWMNRGKILNIKGKKLLVNKQETKWGYSSLTEKYEYLPYEKEVTLSVLDRIVIVG